jgi:hypothetical protein
MAHKNEGGHKEHRFIESICNLRAVEKMDPVIARIEKMNRRRKMDSAYQLKRVEEIGKRAIGRSEYIRFLRGEKLGYDEAISAHCYECGGFYNDGVCDCKSTMCPLYQYMPYRGQNAAKRENMGESTPTTASPRP